MKNKLVYVLSVFVVSVVISGCTTAEKKVQTAVDGTYQAVMETDAWIKENMW